MTLYEVQAVLHLIIALLGYGAIAGYIAPRFSADGPRGWVKTMQASAICFFIGCALHHFAMAHHLLSDPQPWMVTWDHMLIELLQAIAAPLFLIAAARLGQIRIGGRP